MGLFKLKKNQQRTEEGEEYENSQEIKGISEDSTDGSEEELELGVEKIEPTNTNEKKAQALSGSSNSNRSKTKVMILASRGINARQRHLLDDLCLLMPHFKKESKFDSKKDLFALNELAELDGCSHVVYFEARKPQELFMWMAKSPAGPSIRFHVQNIHTLEELHFTGNCMKGTRPIIVFDPSIEQKYDSQGAIIKELLMNIFGVPKNHRKVRPHIDHVLYIGCSDDRIWMRNYQLREGAGAAEDESHKAIDGIALEEIGPRFVLHPVIILEGGFGGRVLWKNPHYVPPSVLRTSAKYGQALKHKQRALDNAASSHRRSVAVLPDNEVDHIFD